MKPTNAIVPTVLGLCLVAGGFGCVMPPRSDEPLFVDAGADRVASGGETVTLEAVATGGSPPYSFVWDIVESPGDEENRTIPDNERTTIETLPLVEGRTVYRVTVTDADAETDPVVDFVVIEATGGLNVEIVTPTDGRGRPESPVVGMPFALQSVVTGGGQVEFLWERVNGVDAVFSDEFAADVTFTPAEAGEVVVRLTVTEPATGRTVSRELALTVAPTGRPRVVMQIASDAPGVSGQVVFELFDDAAPMTVENFLRYVDASFYDGLTWHRASRNSDGSPFVVQTGGFRREADMLIGVDPLFDPVTGEPDNGLSNQPGTIAMALSNNDPNSGTSQFFVNLADNSFLDDTFTVFGEVVEGFEIITAMAELETTTMAVDVGGQLPDVPVTEVTITTFERAEVQN